MIISPGRRYVFVHIPKTGGTSLALALEARAHKDDILIGDTPKARRRKGRLKSLNARGRLWKHSTLADIDGVLEPGVLERLFAVTLVRNPWDRTVSYYHWLQEQSFDHPAVMLAKTLDFSAFLNHPRIMESLSRHPAASYMTTAAGQEHADLYIRLEHYSRDVQPLEAHLGFAIALPHENRSARPEAYQQAYSAEDRDLLGRLCAEDIARFSYRF